VSTNRFSAGHVVLAAVALLVGAGLGRMSLQSALRDAEAEIARAEAHACADGSEVGRQIARALGGGGVVDVPEPPEPLGSPEPEAPPVVQPPTVPEPDAGPEVVIAGEGDPRSDDRVDQLDALADTVAIRKAQARQALIEQVQPSEDQMQRIDLAVGRMNDILVEEAAILMEVARGGEPSRRDGLEFARNSIDALLEAEDAVFDTLSDEQLDRVDPEVLDPLGFVDPTVIETLAELER